MADTPILFHDPTSEPSRTVHWFAVAAGIPLTIRTVWLSRNEHRSEAFLAVNPRHQVPALTHGDLRLSEATAIIRYLAEINGKSDEWLGADARERARINQLLSWYHSNIRRKSTIDYFLPVLLAPSYLGAAPPPRERIEALRAGLGVALDDIEDFLGEAPFLGGPRAMVPDFLFASEIFALDCDPEKERYFAGRTRLNAWRDRMRTHPNYAEVNKAWNTLVPHLKEKLAEPPSPGRHPSWVAAICEKS